MIRVNDTLKLLTLILITAMVGWLVALTAQWGAQKQIFVALGSVALVWVFRRSVKTLFIAFGILAIFLPLLTLNATSLLGEQAGNIMKLLNELLLSIIVIKVVIAKLGDKAKLRSWNTFVLLMWLSFAGILSSLTSGRPWYLISADLLLMIEGFLFFIAMRNVQFKERDIKGWLHLYLALGIVVFFLAIADVLFFPTFRILFNNVAGTQFRFGMPSAISIFTHPGSFGFFMSVMFSFSLGLAVYLRKWVFTSSSILFLIGVLLSGRVKPLLAIPLSIVFVAPILLADNNINMWFSIKRRAGSLLVISALVIISFGIFFQPARVFIKERVESFISEGISENQRLALYATSFDLALRHFPFGSGLSTFGGIISRDFYSPVYKEYGLNQLRGLSEETGQFIMDAHWPYVLGEIGIIGLILYLSILYSIWRNIRILFATADSPLLKGYYLGCLLIFIQALLQAFVSPVFQGALGIYFTLAIMGISVSSESSSKIS